MSGSLADVVDRDLRNEFPEYALRDEAGFSLLCALCEAHTLNKWIEGGADKKLMDEIKLKIGSLGRSSMLEGIEDTEAWVAKTYDAFREEVVLAPHMTPRELRAFARSRTAVGF